MTTKQLQTIPPYNKVKWCLFPPGDHLPLLIHPLPPSPSRPQNFSIEQLNTSIYIIFKVSDPKGARRHVAISQNFFHQNYLASLQDQLAVHTYDQVASWIEAREGLDDHLNVVGGWNTSLYLLELSEKSQVTTFKIFCILSKRVYVNLYYSYSY